MICPASAPAMGWTRCQNGLRNNTQAPTALTRALLQTVALLTLMVRSCTWIVATWDAEKEHPASFILDEKLPPEGRLATQAPVVKRARA